MIQIMNSKSKKSTFNKRAFWSRICLMILTIMIPLVTSAHPHVFINNQVDFVFDSEGLKGFQFRWLFDEMSSVAYVMEHDINGDLKLDKKESKSIKKGAFDNLKNFHYMTYVSINGEDFKVRYVKDFEAKLIDGRLQYSFFIPCHVKAIKTDKTIIVSVYDEEYFIDFFLSSHIKVVASEIFEHRFDVRKNEEKSFYFGQIKPLEIILQFKKAG